MEFSKKLLISDYLFMALLVVLSCFFEHIVEIAVVWGAQVGVSSGFYYWKARQENKVKIPILVLNQMPKKFTDKVDLTEIIKSIIESN